MKHEKSSRCSIKKRLLALGLAAMLTCGSLLPVYAHNGASAGDLAPGVQQQTDADGNVSYVDGAQQDAGGYIVHEYGEDSIVDWSQVDPDQLIVSPYPDDEIMDPGFAIPTITYRFWLTRKDETALAAFDTALASGTKLYGMTAAEYTELYGPNEGLFSAIHIADGGSLWDNSFANPSAADAPDAGMPVFAGWYTLDGSSEEQDFTFDTNCSEEHIFAGVVAAAKSETVDVFARWSRSAEDQAEPPTTDPNASDTLEDHTYNKWYAALVSSSDPAFEGLLEQYTADEGFCDWLDTLPEDEIRALSERMDAATQTLEARAVSARTVRVGGRITLYSSREPSDLSNRSYEWRMTGTTEIVSLDQEDPGTTGKKGSVRVTGQKTGRATVEYGYTSRGSWTRVDSFTLNVIAESEYEPLYLYALHPSLTWTGAGTMNSVSNWYGIGIAKIREGRLALWDPPTSIAGAASIEAQRVAGTFVLEPYRGDYTYYRSNGTEATTNTYAEYTSEVSSITRWNKGSHLFPDLVYNNVTYKYWDGEGVWSDTSPYYTIEWVELKLATGANAGDWNDHNAPVVDSGQTSSNDNAQFHTRHLDGVIHFSTNYKVQFKTVEPNRSAYETLDPSLYTSDVESGWATATIIRPENRTSRPYDILGNTEEHAGWTFSGWYLDEELTQKASFDPYTRIESLDTDGDHVVTYYGKWTRETTNVTLEKQVTGLIGDKTKAFAFTVQITKDGQTVTEGITAQKGDTEVTDWAANGFTLKHGESIVFHGVPIGSTLTVTERDTTDYAVSADLPDAQAYPAGRGEDAVFAAVVGAEYPGRITITNHKTLTPDAGVELGSAMPYWFTLCAGALGTAALRRRHRREG